MALCVFTGYGDAALCAAGRSIHQTHSLFFTRSTKVNRPAHDSCVMNCLMCHDSSSAGSSRIAEA
eukprot:6820144-Prymnesium_polylepis.2